MLTRAQYATLRTSASSPMGKHGGLRNSPPCLPVTYAFHNGRGRPSLSWSHRGDERNEDKWCDAQLQWGASTHGWRRLYRWLMARKSAVFRAPVKHYGNAKPHLKKCLGKTSSARLVCSQLIVAVLGLLVAGWNTGWLRGQVLIVERIRLRDMARYREFHVQAENAQSCSGVYAPTYAFPQRYHAATKWRWYEPWRMSRWI